MIIYKVKITDSKKNVFIGELVMNDSETEIVAVRYHDINLPPDTYTIER